MRYLVLICILTMILFFLFIETIDSLRQMWVDQGMVKVEACDCDKGDE